MKINISAPNLALICIDSREEDGRLYHKYAREAVVFHQYSRLVLVLEDLFDAIGYPQASVQARRFDGKKEEIVGFAIRQPEIAWGMDAMLAMRGRIATFAVHVKLRQNATWQGECYWLEGEKNALFVSELELLKLIGAVIHRQSD